MQITYLELERGHHVFQPRFPCVASDVWCLVEEALMLSIHEIYVCIYVWMYVSFFACIFDHIHCSNIYHVFQSRFPCGTLGPWNVGMIALLQYSYLSMYGCIVLQAFVLSSTCPNFLVRRALVFHRAILRAQRGLRVKGCILRSHVLSRSWVFFLNPLQVTRSLQSSFHGSGGLRRPAMFSWVSRTHFLKNLIFRAL